MKVRSLQNFIIMMQLIYPTTSRAAFSMFKVVKTDIGDFLYADMSDKISDGNGASYTTSYAVPDFSVL